jgi:hypothetical protein
MQLEEIRKNCGLIESYAARMESIYQSQTENQLMTGKTGEKGGLYNHDLEGDLFHDRKNVEILSKPLKDAFKDCLKLGGKLPILNDKWRMMLSYGELRDTIADAYQYQPIMAQLTTSGAIADNLLAIDLEGKIQAELVITESGLTEEEKTAVKTGATITKAVTIDLNKTAVETSSVTINSDVVANYICLKPVEEMKNDALTLDTIREGLIYLARLGTRIKSWTEDLLGVMDNVKTIYLHSSRERQKIVVPRSRALHALEYTTRRLRSSSLYNYDFEDIQAVQQLEQAWNEAGRKFKHLRGNQVRFECTGECINSVLKLTLKSRQGRIYTTKVQGRTGLEGRVFSIQPFVNNKGLRVVGNYLVNVDHVNYFYDELPGPRDCTFDQNEAFCYQLPVPLLNNKKCGEKLMDAEADFKDCALKLNQRGKLIEEKCGSQEKLYYNPPNEGNYMKKCTAPKSSSSLTSAGTIEIESGCELYDERGLNVETRTYKENAREYTVTDDMLEGIGVNQIKFRMTMLWYAFAVATFFLFGGGITLCCYVHWEKSGRKQEAEEKETTPTFHETLLKNSLKRNCQDKGKRSFLFDRAENEK